MLKKVVLVSFILFSINNLIGQTINGNDVKDIDVEYIQIVGTARIMSSKLNIQIDFGQSTKFFSSGKDTQIKDKDNKPVKFNSMIDALNFMNGNGYEFVQAYVISMGNNSVYHYLMKRRENL